MKKRSNLRQCRSDKGRKVNSSQWMARFYLLIIKMNMKSYLLLFYRTKKPKWTRDPWIERIEDWGVSRGTISRFLDRYFSKILAPVKIGPDVLQLWRLSIMLNAAIMCSTMSFSTYSPCGEHTYPISTKPVQVLVWSQSLVSNRFFVFRHPKHQLRTRKSGS